MQGPQLQEAAPRGGAQGMGTDQTLVLPLGPRLEQVAQWLAQKSGTHQTLAACFCNHTYITGSRCRQHNSRWKCWCRVGKICKVGCISRSGGGLVAGGRDAPTPASVAREEAGSGQVEVIMHAGEGGSAGTGAGDPGPAAGAASGGAADDALNVCGPTEGIAVVPFPEAVDAAASGDHSRGAAGAATPAGTELVGRFVIHPFAPGATFAAGSHADADKGVAGFTPSAHCATAAAGGLAAIK